MMTLVSNFDHLRDLIKVNWKSKILKLTTRLLKKAAIRITKLQLQKVNLPP